jgi:hypothetical protein
MKQHLDLGVATIDRPAPIVAGSWVTLTYTYTVGHPIDDSGALRIVFRSVGDFGTPQFTDSTAPNYVRVHTDGDCTLTPRWDPRGNPRPWWLTLQIDVQGGYLDRGQQIVVVFGDRSGGSPGWRAQTFCERTFEFKTLVDPIATCLFKELPHSPTIEIVPGPPARAVCVAPSQAIVDQLFTYWLKLEDRWGNPIARPRELVHPGLSTVGVHTVRAGDAETSLSAESNPIAVVAQPPSHGCYWADLHGQSEETVGTNLIDDYLSFARDMALIDVVGHQGNDMQIGDDLWRSFNEATARAYQPGRFVTLPGYEWSGNTPLGGDRNVYYEAEGGPLVHSSADLLPDQETRYPIAYTADELFAILRQQEDPKALVIAHVGGRYADMAMHDDDVEVAVEVHSAWGTFEWLLEDALERGYRVGVVANSDGHKGRPGASYPGASTFGSLGGLTAVLAGALDRQSVAAALRARRCYATTGHRPLLDVTLALPNGSTAMMGEVVPWNGGIPELKVHVVGTGPLQAVWLRNGLRTLSVWRPPVDDGYGAKRIKITWGGAERRGRARLAVWDGSLSVEDNAIIAVQPINAWNPERPIEQPQSDLLTWRSITTGGACGAIITLAEPDVGALHVQTRQGALRCAIADLSDEPLAVELGGVGKRIEVARLPNNGGPRAATLALPLIALQAGDNPLYVRVDQEDGHMAWSSPIYLVGRRANSAATPSARGSTAAAGNATA